MENRKTITSLANEKIKKYAKLKNKKFRDEEGLFIVEGSHLVEEAKKSAEIVEILTSVDIWEGTLVTKEIIQKISDTESPQQILAICKKPSIDKEFGSAVIALNNVQDPGNVGSIIRTAVAFGMKDILISGADPYSPKAVRSSQGAVFRANIKYVRDITAFFSGYELIGANASKTNAVIYDEYKPTSAYMLIMGSEGSGIEPRIIEMLDKEVYIPIEFESLNVAAASAILINKYTKFDSFDNKKNIVKEISDKDLILNVDDSSEPIFEEEKAEVFDEN